MNIKDIKELILTIDKTSIQRVDIEGKEGKISISKAIYADGQKHEIKNEKKEVLVVEENIEVSLEDIYIVKSPIVGVYYEASSPDEKAFVKVGARVEKGQSLCIIEAMKIMNGIESEESGEVIEIMVNNEDPVEYGQPLMKIRR
ncbi:acetyl-CoA carboxylase biotin carboxyl carrier protein [Marinisporobacter balticus]|uniref:Biotin carboxyl carrier protein of acetyl-CoA carboxylase n=1 Tax=Marinisporobacter balticus TaxID=2018667 RepID=A0A4R2LAS0_9FIRM|nr:acetyl-CoA carboxylase biotin carboxyl carrier protein [Marinisporobacter balticus]TCO79868.1 acetyl-CoA carboxylase biotin carboxyl carrier protein [Marinisporobacter balticus]